MTVPVVGTTMAIQLPLQVSFYSAYDFNLSLISRSYQRVRQCYRDIPNFVAADITGRDWCSDMSIG